MAINPEKLEKAFARATTAKGVPAPASLEMSIEKLLATRQVELWVRSVNAAVGGLGTSDGFADATAASIRKAIAGVYRQYSGLTKLSKDLRAQYLKGDKIQRAAFNASVKKAIGVGVQDLLKDSTASRALEKRLKDSLGLVDGLDKRMQKRLALRIRESLEKGQAIPDIQKALIKEAHVPASRAKLIARDQMGKLFSELAQLRQQEIGVTEYIWRTTGDSAVRSSHASRDGKRYRWDDPPAGGHPGEDVNCRCVAEPYFESAEPPEAA